MTNRSAMLMFLIVAILAGPGCSSVYVDVAIGVKAETDWIEENATNPIGKLSVGYPFNNDISIEIEHISSLRNKDQDYGLNTLWINKRFK